MIKNKDRILIVMVACVFFLLCCMVWLFPDKEYSRAERRRLRQAPEVTVENIGNGKFMSAFEEYSLDQFPLRDTFRSLKAMTSLKADNNGIYVVEGGINSMDYPLKEENLHYASKKFMNLYEKYLRDSNCRVYLSIIPDKNYFYAEENGYLSIDYDRLVSIVKEENDYMTYIDIFPLLTGEDYYGTDTHWKQEALPKVSQRITQVMGSNVHNEYETYQTGEDFYGVYYGQAALPVRPDQILYLSNLIIEGYEVFDYQNNKEINVYDLSKVTDKDPYELFVGGPVSLVTIENDFAENQKELIVFRDSFGSSLAPLLAQGYKKTTLIDIRYIQSAVLGNFVDFENADVLFLYSTMVLNNSETLK